MISAFPRTRSPIAVKEDDFHRMRFVFMEDLKNGNEPDWPPPSRYKESK